LIHSYPELNGVGFRLWGVEPKTLAAAEGLSAEVAAAGSSVARAIAGAVQSRVNLDSPFSGTGTGTGTGGHGHGRGSVRGWEGLDPRS
jgi:hypothetical protein